MLSSILLYAFSGWYGTPSDEYFWQLIKKAKIWWKEKEPGPDDGPMITVVINPKVVIPERPPKPNWTVTFSQPDPFPLGRVLVSVIGGIVGGLLVNSLYPESPIMGLAGAAIGGRVFNDLKNAFFKP